MPSKGVSIFNCMANITASTVDEVYQLLSEVKDLQKRVNSLKDSKGMIVEPLIDFIYLHLKSGKDFKSYEAFDHFNLN